MKRISVLMLAGLLLSIPMAVLAQRGSGGWCTNNNYSRLFNPNTIEEVQGTVMKVEQINPEKGMSAGLHLMVSTANQEQISVHLGPVWFLDKQEMNFANGDAITITGSRIVYENHPAIIALEITKGTHVLLLRDRKGFPQWNAWRKTRRGNGRRGNIGR